MDVATILTEGTQAPRNSPSRAIRRRASGRGRCSSIRVSSCTFLLPSSYDTPLPQLQSLDHALHYYRRESWTTIGEITNPPLGGPGGSGVEFVLGYGPDLSTMVGGGYDVVSWDPRGVGHTEPGAPECFSRSFSIDGELLFLLFEYNLFLLFFLFLVSLCNGDSLSLLRLFFLKEDVFSFLMETSFHSRWKILSILDEDTFPFSMETRLTPPTQATTNGPRSSLVPWKPRVST